jgi:hypothetical protein
MGRPDLDVAPRAAAGRALVPGLPDDVIALPHWRQQSTTLLVTLDRSEHARRGDTQTGPVPYDSMELLTLMLRLPHGEQVPLAEFDQRDRRRLRGARNSGAVSEAHTDRGAAAVVRHALRPLRVHLAVVSGPPIAGLEQAGSFAPFCARAVLLRKHPGEDYLFEASFYGVGIAIPGPDPRQDAPVSLLAPRPWVPKRHTPAGWNFQETAYKQLLTHPDLIPVPDGVS